MATTSNIHARGIAQGVISAGPITYYGFTIRNTSASVVAQLRFWDNATQAAGDILEEITLLAGESADDFYGPQGIRCVQGLYVSVDAGAAEGSIRLG